MIHHIPKDLFGDPVQLHRFRLIDRVKQRWKGIAQVEAATASMANIENPLQFFKQGFLVVKIRIFPIQWMPLRGSETTFTTAFYGCGHIVFSRMFSI
jgi:hypothetical protein